MNQNLVDITIVLDRSGSMGEICEATVEGLNGFIQSQRGQTGDVRFTLVQFDDIYESVFTALPLEQVRPVKLKPRGATALLDAVGRAIQETGARLAAMPEAKRPGTVLFVIQTDGLENASREWTSARLNDAIRHQREQYSWEFIFLGANQDAIATAAAMGISASSSMIYAATAETVQATYEAVSARTREYTAARQEGRTAQIEFSDAERDRSVEIVRKKPSR